MQRDLGLTADQVRIRIARDEKGSRADAALRRSLGSAYAGGWLTADTGTLVVAVTGEAAAARVRAAGTGSPPTRTGRRSRG